MITWVRRADMHDGKEDAAFAWAVKVANHINENIPGANTQVIRNIGGPVYQVRWVSNYESLAVLEEIMKKVRADSGYQELLGEARDQQLFISSSIVDSLYEAIG